MATPQARQRKPFYKHLYFWVLTGIALGIVVGQLFPGTAAQLQPVGDSFVNLIRMVITPVIFCTVVSGIASVRNLGQVGRVGIKALVYFEVLTTVALILGMIVMNVFRPGDGVHATNIQPNPTVEGYIRTGETSHWYDPIVHIFPNSVVGAFANGDILQVLFFAIVFAFAVQRLGEPGQRIVRGVDLIGRAMFGVIRIIMYAAPVGAFGAMAYTIGRFGIDTLTSLAGLIGTFYGTALFFVLVVLGSVCALVGINILQLLRYIKEELLIVLGTSSSESVLPQLMGKLEYLGAPKQIVGLVVPSGYSFNLDGTCIYLTLAALYVAQAQDVSLSLATQLGVLAVLLITSKGAAGVTGSGFIVLAATLASVQTIPVAGIMLIFGIDRFMSECRSLTNLVGNTVATIVVSKWEGQFDNERAQQVLRGDVDELEMLERPDDAEAEPAPA